MWWPIALAADLKPAQVMPATLADADIAVWRSASGHLAAFGDRCPHRGMRLSHGFVRGEALSCLYHGWSYSSSGPCLRIPAHPNLAVPSAIRAQTYAVTEASGLIWVAPQATQTQPPALAGTPLRSMPFLCTADRLQTHLTAQSLAPNILITQTLTLALQPKPGRLMVHALTTGEPIPQSRALEALRREVEAA